MNLLNNEIQNLIEKIKSIIKKQDQQQNLIQSLYAYYQLYQQALDYKFSSEDEIQIINVFKTFIVEQYSNKSNDLEISSSFLLKNNLPDPFEYFVLIYISHKDVAIIDSLFEIFVSILLDCKINDIIRMLIFNIMMTQSNWQKFKHSLRMQIENFIDNKNFSKKQRECVPFIQIIPFIYNNIKDQEKIQLLLNGKFDLAQRHVMKNILSTTLSSLLENLRSQEMLKLTAQNINKIVSWLGDKKHFSTAFFPLVEYAIQVPQFQVSPNFGKLVSTMKTHPIHAFPAYVRLVCQLCFTKDIFGDQIFNNSQSIHNQHLLDLVSIFFCSIQSIFQPKSVLSLGAKMLQFDIAGSEIFNNVQLSYFKFIPYLTMLPLESFIIPTEYALLGAILHSCNSKVIESKVEPSPFLQFVQFLNVSEQNIKASDFVYQNNIEYYYHFVLHQKDINVYTQTLQNLISKNHIQISKNELKILLQQNINYQLFYSQELIAVIIQQIKGKNWFYDGFSMINQAITQDYQLVNNKLIYSLIVLFLTTFRTNSIKVDQFIRQIYQKFKSSYPETLFDSKQFLIQQFFNSDNLEFINYINKQILKDICQDSMEYSNIVLIFYFAKNDQQYYKFYNDQFFKQFNKNELINFSNNFLFFDCLTLGKPQDIQTSLNQYNKNPYQKLEIKPNSVIKDDILLLKCINKDYQLLYTQQFTYLITVQILSSINCQSLNNIIQLAQTENNVSFSDLFSYMNSSLFFSSFLSLQWNFNLFLQQNKVINYNNTLRLMVPFLLLINQVPSLGQLFNLITEDVFPSLNIQNINSYTFDTLIQSILIFFKQEQLQCLIQNECFNPNEEDFLLQFGYQQLSVFINNQIIHHYIESLTQEERRQLTNNQFIIDYKLPQFINKFQILDKINKYQYMNNFYLYNFLNLFNKNQTFKTQYYYLEQVLSTILNSIRTNQQMSLLLINILQFFQEDSKQIPLQFIQKIFQAFNQALIADQLELLILYDFTITIDLYQLFDDYEERKIINISYQDSFYLLEKLQKYPNIDIMYLESIILKQDLAKRVSFAFDTQINLDQARQYFTISQLLLLMFIISNDSRTISYSNTILELLIGSQIISTTWIKSIIQVTQQIDLSKNVPDYYQLVIQKLQIFIPGILWSVSSFKKQFEDQNIIFNLPNYLKNVISDSIQTFLSQSFCIQIDDFSYKPTLFQNTFVDVYENSDQSSTSNTSSSLSITLNMKQQDNYQLSELFLNLFFLLITFYKDTEFQQIFVKQVLKKFDTIIIIKFMQFYAHNTIFLQTYGIEMTQKIKESQQIQITEKTKKKIYQKTSNIFTTNQTIVKQTGKQKVKKEKRKYSISHVSEMFETNFDYKLLENIIIQLAVYQQNQILQELINFTFIDQSYDIDNILQFASQQQEFIYGFVARKLIAKILQQSLLNKTRTDDLLLVTALTALSIDGVYTECFKTDQSNANTESSNNIPASQRSQFSMISTSSKKISTQAETSKPITNNQIDLNNSYNSQYLQLLVPSFYFFQILLNEKLDTLNNITVLLSPFLSKNSVLFDFIHVLSLQINGLGIVTDLQAPWMNPDRLLIDQNQKSVIEYSLPVIIDHRGQQSSENRTNVLIMIKDALQSQLFTNNFVNFSEDKCTSLIRNLFRSYINQLQLLDFNQTKPIRNQQQLIESILITILEKSIQSQRIGLFPQYMKMIKILQNSQNSFTFAWDLFYIFIAHTPQKLIINQHVNIYSILQKSQFGNLFRFLNAQTHQTPTNLPLSEISVLASYTVQYDNIQKWLVNSIQLKNPASSPQKACTQFCTQAFETSISDLNQFLSLNLQLKQLDFSQFTQNFHCFSITRQDLTPENYKAILLAQFFNILIQRHFNPKTPIAAFANQFAYTMKYANSIKKIAKEEKFYDIINFLTLLNSIDNNSSSFSNLSVFSAKFLIQNLIEWGENIANSFIQIMKFDGLMLSSVILLVQTIRMMNQDGAINAIQSVQFSDFSCKKPEIVEIFNKLVGKVNYRGSDRKGLEISQICKEWRDNGMEWNDI